jgi:hypothetical protein
MSDLGRWARVKTGAFRFGVAARLLTPSEATRYVHAMRERHTDDELRAIRDSGEEDFGSLSRSQLWRLARGESYDVVVADG